MRPEVDDFAAAEDRDIVRRALGKLTRRQRAAVVLTELLGYTSEQVNQFAYTALTRRLKVIGVSLFAPEPAPA